MTGISQEATALNLLRVIMNRIHEGGNIFNSKDRFDAYKLCAAIASNMRQDLLRRFA